MFITGCFERSRTTNKTTEGVNPVDMNGNKSGDNYSGEKNEVQPKKEEETDTPDSDIDEPEDNNSPDESTIPGTAPQTPNKVTVTITPTNPLSPPTNTGESHPDPTGDDDESSLPDVDSIEVSGTIEALNSSVYINIMGVDHEISLGTKNFSTTVPKGVNPNISVRSQSPNELCFIANASSTIQPGDLTGINIKCINRMTIAELVAQDTYDNSNAAAGQYSLRYALKHFIPETKDNLHQTIDQVKSITIDGLSIRDGLDALNYFINLENLVVKSSVYLNKLNLPHLSQLKTVQMEFPETSGLSYDFTEFNLDNQINLESLTTRHLKAIKTLSTKNLIKLKHLSIDFRHEILNLESSKDLEALTFYGFKSTNYGGDLAGYLRLSHPERIKSLHLDMLHLPWGSNDKPIDFTPFTGLENLYIHEHAAPLLDLTQNAQLTKAELRDAVFSEIKLPVINRIETLILDNLIYLTNFDINNFDSIKYFTLSGHANQLTSLDFTSSSALVSVDISNNRYLTALDLSTHHSLETIKLSGLGALEDYSLPTTLERMTSINFEHLNIPGPIDLSTAHNLTNLRIYNVFSVLEIHYSPSLDTSLLTLSLPGHLNVP